MPDSTPATPPDEVELWSRMRTSSASSARQALFDLHVSYAKAIAAKLFANRHRDDVEFSDFFQLACVGLLESIDRFDLDRAISFRTFATRRIEGNVLDGIIRQTEAQEQIALRTRLKAERVTSIADGSRNQDPRNRLQQLSEVAVGLAIGFILEETGMYFADTQDVHESPTYESVAWQEIRSKLLASIVRLPDREHKIIAYHYLHGLTFEQIGDLMELTKGRISQLHHVALSRLRRMGAARGEFALIA